MGIDTSGLMDEFYAFLGLLTNPSACYEGSEFTVLLRVELEEVLFFATLFSYLYMYRFLIEGSVVLEALQHIIIL